MNALGQVVDALGADVSRYTTLYEQACRAVEDAERHKDQVYQRMIAAKNILAYLTTYRDTYLLNEEGRS